jgi:group I intron endonuclease
MIVAVSGFKGDHLPITSGIYQIRNKLNGKVYIGSAVNIRARISTHHTALENGYHKNPRLRNAWTKYGEAAFEVVVLELVAEASDLLEREQFWIDSCSSADRAFGYNLNPVAGSNLGRTFGADVRAKISVATTTAMNDPVVKARHEQATRQAMANPETRTRTREAALRRWQDPAYRQRQLELRQSASFAKRASERARGQATANPEQFLAFRTASVQPEALVRRGISSRAARLRERTRVGHEAYSARMSQLASKRYMAVSPAGEPIEVQNLLQFCRSSGLTYSVVMKVLSGKVSHHKHWTFRHLDGMEGRDAAC